MISLLIHFLEPRIDTSFLVSSISFVSPYCTINHSHHRNYNPRLWILDDRCLSGGECIQHPCLSYRNKPHIDVRFSLSHLIVNPYVVSWQIPRNWRCWGCHAALVLDCMVATRHNDQLSGLSAELVFLCMDSCSFRSTLNATVVRAQSSYPIEGWDIWLGLSPESRRDQRKFKGRYGKNQQFNYIRSQQYWRW